MIEALAVAFGGALGSLGRWGLGNALRAVLPGVPAATFAANVLAGLLIGVVTGMNATDAITPEARAFLSVGLCGGLSTFSAFSNETFAFIEAGEVGAAVVNIVANVAVCLLAVWAGNRLGAALV